ncbi:hypothetical protein FIBSPDRAFT_859348 [Athelia psychrophila]|uniref:Uncharacterized protein n=1 Tax=Athelia psychrophila TaxID=1759441 RepID=A0A166L4D9_9AGAM|nr:hypothetical protein FIBSPDRAFT_859348 [Fibularhizoctonia sp. CBS 109695]
MRGAYAGLLGEQAQSDARGMLAMRVHCNLQLCVCGGGGGRASEGRKGTHSADTARLKGAMHTGSEGLRA